MSPPVGGWAGGETPGETRRPSEVIPARRLLRRLVAVVAEPTTPQQRLDKIVKMIAADLVAEVCSVYVQRAGDVLELFATEGLAREAVHRTRLRVGEGLVGTIAATGDVINTSDAQRHPNFAYRPETREEIYNSFLGVPIVRSGRVVGVLTIQNTAHRLYDEDEIDAMQIIASVLAEMFASGGLLDRELYTDLGTLAPERRRLEALRLVEGVAIGRAWLHEPRIEISRLLADDPAAEQARLDRALEELKRSLDRLLARADLASGEHREVLEAYRMFADDTGWIRRIREAIDTGLSAEAAVRRVQEQTRLRLGHAADPVLKERLLDLDDLANRLLLHLAGRSTLHDPAAVPDDCILIARSLSAAELVEYDRNKLKGIILEEGSKTAHVTIVARALDIPLVGRVEGAMTLFEPGDPVALDAENGVVFLRPSEDVLQAFARTVQARNERRRQLAALKDQPAVTRDGIEIWLGINAAFLADLPALLETGAAGIGLFRTELGFMTRPSWPSVEEQAQIYKRILDLAGDRRVVFRTLDIGSDKHLPYWRMPAEGNPALGWRAIRIGLDRPALLRAQLRALLAAAEGRPLALMFPMVAEVAELRAARALLLKEMTRHAALGGKPPASVEVGVMFEVPALYWQLDALLNEVDFVSVGTNDLLQFLFACDRGNPILAERYDVLAPAALAFLRDLVERCRAAGVPLTVCGEMASRPLEAMALVGIGVRRLSVSPSELYSVKAMVRSLDVGRLARFLDRVLGASERSLRQPLLAWAHDHAVVLPPGQNLPT